MLPFVTDNHHSRTYLYFTMTTGKYARASCYALLFFLLLGISAWDVSHILTEYLTDNKRTVIEKSNLKNCSPILQSPVIYLRYDEKGSVFPETWSIHPNDTAVMKKRWPHRHDFFCDIPDLSNISLQDKIDLAELYAFMWNIDMGYYRDQEINNTAKELNIERTLLYSAIDGFSKNRTCAESLLQTVWRQIKSDYVQISTWSDGRYNIPRENTTPDNIDIYVLDPAGVMFRINPRHDLRKWHPDQFMIDNRSPDKNGDQLTINTKAASIQVIFPESYEFHAKIPDGHFADITVQISNLGVFKSDQFPPCTKDYPTKEECMENAKSRVMADICGCVPSKDRDHFPNDTRPYCTMDNYARCRETANNEWKIKQEWWERQCVPCTLIKNNYFLSTNFVPIDYSRPTPDQRYYRTLLTFTCLDTVAVVYKDDVQFTFPQLISQIGGDLGLYTGFNMLSVFHIVLCLYTLYKIKTAKSYDFSNPYNQLAIPYGIQYVLQYIKTQVVQASAGNPDTHTLVRKYQDLEREHAKWIQEIESLKQTTNALSRKVSTVSLNSQDVNQLTTVFHVNQMTK